MKNELNEMLAAYSEMKAKFPDAVLLFRAGDFYETFAEDAITCANVLGTTLARREDVELSGFPRHALDKYLPRLVRAGRRVAICEKLN